MCFSRGRNNLARFFTKPIEKTYVRQSPTEVVELASSATEKMNRDVMGAHMTGDPDRNLVVMMMPHHQGAIDMARIYLRDG
jgi:uncharacterized protein (DUF305 family)